MNREPEGGRENSPTESVGRQLYLREGEGQTCQRWSDTGSGTFRPANMKEPMEREQQLWLKILIEAIPDWAIAKDERGGWLAANPLVVELFELGSADYRGKTNRELAREREIYRDSFLADAESDRMAWEATTKTYSCLAIATREGTVRAFEIEKVPMFSPSGDRQGIIAIGREITERLQMQRARWESERRASQFATSAPLMLWTANREGEREFFDCGWIEFTGRTLAEEVGSGWLESVHREDRQQVVEIYRSAVTTRSKYEQEYRLQNAEGEYRWILEVGVPRDAWDGEFAGYNGWCFDITHRVKAEESLRASVAKNRALANAIPDFMLHLTADGTILDYKEAPENAMQISPNVRVGRSIYEVWPKEIASQAIAYVERSLLTGEIQTWEYQLEVNGICRHREARIVACGKNEAIAILRDITERKQAEAALVCVTQAVDSASDAIAICDATGHHIYQNRAFSELFGYDTVEDLRSAGGPSVVYADSYIAQTVFETIRSGKSWIGSAEQQTRQGRLLQVLLRADAIEDRTGKIIGLITISTDMTERKQVEAALRASEQKLSLHLEQTPLAVVEFNLKGEIVEWNPAAEVMFGYPKAEILGRSACLLVPEHQRPDAKQRWQDLLRHNGGACSISENQRKDGSKIICEWYNTPLVDREGKAIGVASLAQDITERVRAEEALRQQSQRDRLVSATQVRIRQSLNLEEILNTAVSEVRQSLDCDRVVVYRIWPNQTGSVVTESVVSPWPTMLGQSFGEEIFPVTCYERYCQGQVRAIDDLEAENSPTCLIEFLQPYGVKGKMIAPLLHENRLWGLLVAHQCRRTHNWQPFEVEIFDRLSTQLAIAIQQSTLFKQLEAANEELQRLASLDGLTQVANRRAFDEYLDREWRRAIREFTKISLILCDLDSFKLYNDTYGHQAGDTCLKKVATAIALTLNRPADFVARYGGEEFAVILPNTDGEGAMTVAQEIRNNIRGLLIPHSASSVGYVSISLGVAVTLPHPKKSWEKLLAAADRALYEAKTGGRDRAILEKYW